MLGSRDLEVLSCAAAYASLLSEPHYYKHHVHSEVAEHYGGPGYIAPPTPFALWTEAAAGFEEVIGTNSLEALSAKLGLATLKLVQGGRALPAAW